LAQVQTVASYAAFAILYNMALNLKFAALCMASLSQSGTAQSTPLVPESKWRGCITFPTNVEYITGTTVTYSPSWATTTKTSALLDAGKSSDAELKAACAELVPDGHVGEIYVMDAVKAGNDCANCLRMATYKGVAADLLAAGQLVGTVSDTGAQKKWVCGKGFTPPVQPSCTAHLVTESKWRACEGNTKNVKYITGTGVTYSPSWATATETSVFLDAGKNSSEQMQAACSALVKAGQVGEIYMMKPENAGNDCANCLRMAINSASESGLVVGTVADTSAQKKWVCATDAMPVVRPSCPTAAAEDANETVTSSSALHTKLTMTVGLIMLCSA